MAIMTLLVLPGMARLCAENVTIANSNPNQPAAPQLRLSCEWIAMPHAEANRLIHSHAANPDPGNALHASAEKLMAAGVGKLVQQQLIHAISGQQIKAGTLRHFPYPTEHDAPMVSTKVVMQGGNVIQGDFRRAEPSSFQTQDLGFDLSVECTVDDTGHLADLNLAANWTAHADDQKWGQGLSEISLPVFQRCSVFTQALCRHDSWKLVAQLRPTAPAPAAAAQPFASDRVLLFIKATMDEPGPAAAPDATSVQEISVLHEWIELDSQIADSMMDGIPGSGVTAGLRAAAQGLLDAGKATLIDSTYQITRSGQKSKIESVLEFPFPTAHSTPKVPLTIIELPAPTPPLPITRPVFWPTPACPQSLERHLAGTSIEVEAVASDDGTTLDISTAPQIHLPVGLQPHGHGSGFVTQPRFATLKSATRILLKPSQSALLDSYESMPPSSLRVLSPASPPTGNPKRRILLFITAGLQ
ncbi:MAG: hypothetical protein JWL81_2936 [Verrucomicrobiales bacterium]|nr:hypothetical protein [Verrucomicrobiales bacterium]